MQEEIYDALVALKQSVDQQAEQQGVLKKSINELTDMLGHSIDAIKELTEQLEKSQS